MPTQFLTWVSQPHARLETHDTRSYMPRAGMYLLPQPPCPVFSNSHTSAVALDQDKERGHAILVRADRTNLGSCGEPTLQSTL